MNESEPKIFPLPDLGQLMCFIVDCLGVPKNEEPVSYHELKRLRKGGLAPDTYWKVLRSTMDAIVGMFVGNTAARTFIDGTLTQRQGAPVKRYHWRRKGELIIPIPEREAPTESLGWNLDKSGKATNFRDILLHDWNEFIEWHQFILEECEGTPFTNEMGFILWLNIFVIPFLAANLYEYQHRMTAFESGMPGGKLWFIPYSTRQSNNATEYRVVLPVNEVLAWWEDLLGTDLVEHAGLLCDAGDNLEDAKRQVRAWRNEDRPPDKATIERWCKVNWSKHYLGAFTDDSSLPLARRWELCKAFLIRKGLHENTSNWLDQMDADSREKFRNNYRGEKLEREISPFKSTPFSALFHSPDPIAAKLPVEDLIERVAGRYIVPSNEILKARLFVACAFQRGYGKLVKWRNEGVALFICKHFSDVYNYIVELHQDGNSRPKVMARLKHMPSCAVKYACEWLYNEEQRGEMVATIRKAGIRPNS